MTNHTTTETEAQNLYDLIYAYAQDADISNYRMSGDGDPEYRVEPFNPADDPEFAIDNDNTIERDGKTYIPVCWGEDETSALLESEMATGQCWILYRWNEIERVYISDGSIYETEGAAIVETLTDSQYYCAKCAQVFEYRYAEQYGCEQCSVAIGDDNIAGAD